MGLWGSGHGGLAVVKLLRDPIQEEAVDDGNRPYLEPVFPEGPAESAPGEVIDVSATVFVIFASPQISHIDTVQIEEDKKGTEEDVIGDGDDEKAFVFQYTRYLFQDIQQIRQMLEDLRHDDDVERPRRQSCLRQIGGDAKVFEIMIGFRPVEHPLVDIHPRDGKTMGVPEAVPAAQIGDPVSGSIVFFDENS